MKRVVIIGSGNVAEALARALQRTEGYGLTQIIARNTVEGSLMAHNYNCTYGGGPSEMAEADIYIIAVSDRAIETVSDKYDFGDATVAHTAGSVDIGVLSSNIKHKAVLYPLQTFTRGCEVDLKNVPLLIEGTTALATRSIREFAQALSRNVVEYSSRRRAQAHLAAVFACNFTNHMYVIAEELLQGYDMPFELLKSLIRETTDKALNSPSPRSAQTGPAIRNDFKTKSKHCDMLYERADYKNLYINLSKSIWETSKKK